MVEHNTIENVHGFRIVDPEDGTLVFSHTFRNFHLDYEPQDSEFLPMDLEVRRTINDCLGPFLQRTHSTTISDIIAGSGITCGPLTNRAWRSSLILFNTELPRLGYIVELSPALEAAYNGPTPAPGNEVRY